MTTTAVATTTTKVTAAEIADSKTTKRAKECLAETHELMKSTYRTWFLMGQRFLEMQEFGYYTNLNYKTFKELCETEFPNLDYPLIVKSIKVVHELGDFISKKMKKSEYVVPPISTCYKLVSNRDSIPRSKYENLRDLVLDSGISAKEIESKIEQIVEQKKTKTTTSTTTTTTDKKTKLAAVSTEVTPEDKIVSLLTQTEGMGSEFGSVLLWMKSNPEELPEVYDIFIQRVQELWEQLDAVLAFHEKEIS